MNRKKSIVVLIFIICMALLGNVYASTSEINEFEEKTGLTVEKIVIDYNLDNIEYLTSVECDINGIYAYAASADEVNGRFVFIDYNGNVYDFFDENSSEDETFSIDMPKIFRDGVARVKVCFDGIMRYGYIDEAYNWVVEPIFTDATSFSAGHGVGRLTDDVGAVMLDLNGEFCMTFDDFIRNNGYGNYGYPTFSGGYIVCRDGDEVYFLDENLSKTKVDLKPETNLGDLFYGELSGGTLLVLSDAVYDGGIISNYYDMYGSDGKHRYTQTISEPSEYVVRFNSSPTVLGNGGVLFCEAGEFLENVGTYEEKLKSVSADGELLAESSGDYVLISKPFGSVGDVIFNSSTKWCYNTELNQIAYFGDIAAGEQITDTAAYLDADGNVAVIISGNDDENGCHIDDIYVIHDTDTVLNNNIEIVNNDMIPDTGMSDNIRVFINNNPIDFDVEPVLENDRTLVPMRKIFEELGANVVWNEETQTAYAEKDGVKISFTIGSDIMTVDGVAITLEAAVKIADDSRTLVPLRAISEAFGCKVLWSGYLNRVDIVDVID